MPLISIVIPTRNRAYLLQTAIQSALSQNFDDFEVVVSDNYSTDATFETVNKFNDPRLRYVKTSKAMHMPDSWEFALEQARGEYITFLSDDDAIHPNLLKISWNAVTRTSCDIIVWPFGGIYYHDVFVDPSKRNTFEFLQPTKKEYKISRDEILAKVFNCEFTHHLPRPLSSLVARTAISDVKEKFGRLFYPIAPDYTSALALLSVRSNIIYIEDLLLIWGVSKDSIGQDCAISGDATRKFIDEFKYDNYKLFEYTPFDFLTITNCIADSLLRMQELTNVSNTPYNWETYFYSVYQEISVLKGFGNDVSKELDRFFEVLATQPENLRLIIERKIEVYNAKMHKSVFNKLVAKIKNVGYVSAILDKLYYNRRETLKTVNGNDFGFSNIFECSQNIDKICNFHLKK